MPIYYASDIAKLVDRMNEKSNIVDRAAANTLNKSATFAIKESIAEITSEVNLQPNYIKQHLTTTARAKYDNLRVIVSGSERGTLMFRYPTVKTKNGYKIAVNRTGGFREIKNSRMITLRGSGKKSLAVTNRDAVDWFKYSMSKGKRTPAKSRKLQRIISKAASKPNGMTPLHSRSINQLFESVREDIQPELARFMRKTFLADFKRLNK